MPPSPEASTVQLYLSPKAEISSAKRRVSIFSSSVSITYKVVLNPSEPPIMALALFSLSAMAPTLTTPSISFTSFTTPSDASRSSSKVASPDIIMAADIWFVDMSGIKIKPLAKMITVLNTNKNRAIPRVINL